MVSRLPIAACSTLAAFFAEDSSKPPILEMSGDTRAKVLAVFAGLVILGIAMMVLAWLGARMTRRYMNRGPKQRVRSKAPNPDDWASQPMVPKDMGADDDSPPGPNGN